jgi:hypothetical protein
MEVGFKFLVQCVSSPSFGATGVHRVATPTADGEKDREDLARTEL